MTRKRRQPRSNSKSNLKALRKIDDIVNDLNAQRAAQETERKKASAASRQSHR